jgi:hypothetical protein
VASYPGDGNNNSAASLCNAEPVTVGKASPTIGTTPSAGGSTGTTLNDTATVSGGSTPTGNVTFSLYDNPTCSGTAVFTQTVALSSGSATTGPGFTTTTAGTYEWMATYNGDGNNNSVTSRCGDEPVTVGSRPLLTVTANPQTKVYGAANPTPLTYTITGYLPGDPPTVVTTQPTCTTTATTTSVVGSYPIDCKDAGSAKYDFTYVRGWLTVTPATLTVTADDKTRTVNHADPPFTATITGFVNGETTAVVSGAPSFSTTAILASPVGPYPITPGAGTLAAANYTFTYVNGTLTVTDKPVLTVTANNQNRDYGADNPPLTYTITGYIDGDPPSIVTKQPTCTTAATAASLPGFYPITCSGAESDKYAFNYEPGTLTVTGNVVGGESATPPVTSVSSTPPTSDSTPLVGFLICFAFGGLGLLAVQLQRRTLPR